jgi:hypothetical protein
LYYEFKILIGVAKAVAPFLVFVLKSRHVKKLVLVPSASGSEARGSFCVGHVR